MMSYQECSERYSHGFENFLCHVGSEDIEDLPPEEQDDIHCVKKYVSKFDDEVLMLTIKHGLEILALEEFPYEWIEITTNEYNESPQEYYEWVKDLVQILEDEAVKSGKVTAEDVQLLHEGRLDVIIDPGNWKVIRK